MPSDSSLRDLARDRPGLLLGLVTVILAFGVGSFMGLPVGLLTGAALVLAVVIGLMWQSLQHLSGETELTFEEAFTLAAPTAAEEQKRAVLRALKDLEYERSVGKISEEDFVELSARYRAEAKRLILMVDETLQERRRKAEELLEERLAQQGKARQGKNQAEDEEPSDASAEESADAQSADAPASEGAAHGDRPTAETTDTAAGKESQDPPPAADEEPSPAREERTP